MSKLLKRITSVTVALLLVITAIPFAMGEANNTDAPRAYFPYPADLETLPDNFSLPNLFEFFDASADPNGNGVVDSREEWAARSAELKDLLQYYVFGNRLDPLKSDTTIIDIQNNYQLTWADGVQTSAPGWFGYTSLPLLPEGSYSYALQDFSAFGWGVYYANIAPDKSYVHAGDDYDMPGEFADWKAGDTWTEHKELFEEILLPTKTVTMLVKDTNPLNDAYRSEEAKEGLTFTFNVRYPETAPVVDGVVRDAKASRYGAGYPLVVQIGGLSEAQLITLNQNGYAAISVSDTANPDSGQLSLYEKLYPPTDPVVYNDNTIINEFALDSGDLMHSGWAASRAMDALENYMLLSDEEKAAINPDVILPDIDVYSSAITGCSNMAKRALIGGIFDTGDNGDTRFDILAPSDPGGGGLTGFRYSTEGQLFSYEPPVQNSGASVVVHDYAYGLNESQQRAIQNSSEDNWFADRAQIFTVRPDLSDNTPIDAHSLVAIFASLTENRYMICWTGEGQDAWLNSPATVLNVNAAREVFEFLGQGDNLAVVVRDQAHANQDRDLQDLIALMDYEYYGADAIVRKFHPTLTSETSDIAAADGSGTIMPEKTFASVAAMARNPYFLPSAYINWSRPGKHTLWTESNSVTEGVPLTFSFHSDARKVELTLTDGVTKLEAEVIDGVAIIPLSAEQAKAGQYTATAIGDLDPKTIEISGWTVKDALRHSISDNSALGHDVGSGVCFTTPLVNYNSETDPVKLYLNGVELAADIYDYDNKVYVDGEAVPQSGYLQPYGATLILYEGTAGYNVPMGEKCVFGVRNAKIEALQGYVIAMDIEYEKYDPNAGSGSPRMRFKPTHNTLTPQTPVWAPELLQNTPKSGLADGEEYWPLLGNWISDFDENGDLKPVSEIRPLYSAPVESAFDPEVSVASADKDGATIAFTSPVNPRDFALAITGVSGVSFEWADDAMSVRVVYDAPAEGEVSGFVFRCVDADGDMIGAPIALSFAY